MPTPPLAAVIELLLRYHRRALRVLLGDYVPTLLELSEVIREAEEGGCVIPGLRAGGTPFSRQLSEIIRGEAVQRVVDVAGGWEHIAEVVRFYRKSFPTTWAIFADHVLTIAPGGASRLEEESQLERIAKKYGIKRLTTVSEKRKIVPEAIARYAEMIPEGELDALSGLVCGERPARGKIDKEHSGQLPLPL